MLEKMLKWIVLKELLFQNTEIFLKTKKSILKSKLKKQIQEKKAADLFF